MTVMPEQNPLPFPDGQPAPPSAAAADLGATAAALPTAVPVPPDAAPSIAPAVAAARSAKRPWWARLLGRLADPWLSLTIEPDQPSRYDDGTPVVYVLEDYGLSSALIWTRPAARRAALATGAAAGRPAAAQARLPGAVAAQQQQFADPRAAGRQDPFGFAGQAAAGASRARRHGRAPGAGVDLRRPRAGQAERLVRGAVLGKLGAGRPLPAPAGGAAQWPHHHRALRAADLAAPDHGRRPAARAHPAQTAARAAHAFPPYP